jgi:hypothetical protein
MGLRSLYPLLPVYDQYMFLKERSQETFSAPRQWITTVNISWKSNQQPCIWCINYSSQLERQERIVPNPTKERQIPSSSGSTRKCDSETRSMGVRELIGDEWEKEK